MDDLHVAGLGRAQLVGDLVALEGDVQLHLALLRLELIPLAGAQTVLVLLFHHEGEVVQQRILGGIVLAQGFHVGVIVVAVGAGGDLGHAELRVVRHRFGVNDGHHIGRAADAGVLLLGAVLGKAHGQRRVLRQLAGLLARHIYPGQRLGVVGKAVQLRLAQQGLHIVVALCVRQRVRQVVSALLQRHVADARDHVSIRVHGGVGHVHARQVAQVARRQRRVLGQLRAGLARGGDPGQLPGIVGQGVDGGLAQQGVDVHVALDGLGRVVGLFQRGGLLDHVAVLVHCGQGHGHARQVAQEGQREHGAVRQGLVGVLDFVVFIHIFPGVEPDAVRLRVPQPHDLPVAQLRAGVHIARRDLRGAFGQLVVALLEGLVAAAGDGVAVLVQRGEQDFDI